MSDFDAYYRDGLPVQTDFKEDGFGIDPEGCGCTDCICRYAFHPSDTYRLEKAIAQGRTLYNRTGGDVMLPNGYRLGYDQTWRPGAVQDHCPGCICNRD